MEMTISGVSVKLSADEIISALLSEEGKGLWELKMALNKLEAGVIGNKIYYTPTPEGIIDGSKKTFFEHDEMGMFPTQIMPNFKDLLQSDTELPPPPKKSPTVKKKRHRRKRINPKTGKRYYHRKEKKTKFVEAKNNKPIINDEDDPVIPVAKRPSNRSIELNI